MVEKSTTKKVAAAAAAAAGSNKKVVRSKPAHPNTSEMVLAAVTALKDRKGSSLQAIKKYMSSTYKVDTDKTAIFIRRYLRKAVVDGVLVQAKGNGASGSFKLPSSEKKPVKSSGKKRGRPAKSTAAEASKKKSTPKKKKKQGAAIKKAGATSAKKPKVKTITTKKKAGRPKGAKSTPKKMRK